MKNHLIVPALDEPDEGSFVDLALRMASTNVTVVKLGMMPILTLGLARAIEVIRDTSIPDIVLDYQKLGADIPDVSEKIVRMFAGAGVNSLIVFPFSGFATLERIVKTAADCGVCPIVGSHMTHEKFSELEGGYISQDACGSIIEDALELGVKDFVLPGNKTALLSDYLSWLLSWLDDDCTVWCPGIGVQGGDLRKLSEIMKGRNFRAIVGRAITESPNPGETIKKLQGVLAGEGGDHG